MKILPIGVLTLLLVAGLGHATTKGRIMTNGKVSMYQNGQIVNSFAEQGPIDENSLIVCDGTCLVKMQGISLLANDKTMFAVKESGATLDLYVRTGTVNFAVSDISRQFAFHAPNGYVVKSEGFIAPASSDTSVKGFMKVTAKGTEIGMEQGSMIAQTDQGTQSINPGQAILLAMVDVPDINTVVNDKECTDSFWTCLTADEKTALLATGGVGLTGVALVIYSEMTRDDDNTVNSFQPSETPEPASPNH